MTASGIYHKNERKSEGMNNAKLQTLETPAFVRATPREDQRTALELEYSEGTYMVHYS